MRGRRIARARRAERALPAASRRSRRLPFPDRRVRNAQGIAGGRGQRAHRRGPPLLDPEPPSLRRPRHRPRRPGGSGRALRRDSHSRSAASRNPQLRRALSGLHLVLLLSRRAVRSPPLEPDDPASRRTGPRTARCRPEGPAAIHRGRPGSLSPGRLLHPLPLHGGGGRSRESAYRGRSGRRRLLRQPRVLRPFPGHPAPPAGVRSEPSSSTPSRSPATPCSSRALPTTSSSLRSAPISRAGAALRSIRAGRWCRWGA